MIIGASDRMLTAGDIEFEPPQNKIIPLVISGHAVALTAGDTAAQTEICARTFQELGRRTVTDVSEIAEVYARNFGEYRRTRAERTILAPLGLDTESFLARQREMLPQLVDRITTELRSHPLEAETIIAGVDARGAHIYVVGDPGAIACNDNVAFAAIGAGQWHAASQFMFSRYTSQWTFPRASVLTYSAKKRGEVAPGVGRETDMFFIGPGFGRYTYFTNELLEELRRIYEETRHKEDEAAETALKGFEDYVSDTVKKASTQASSQTAQEEADNDTGVSSSTEEG
jgi:20S proteasome alpha/beta subunit